jgi:hypothetical protein
MRAESNNNSQMTLKYGIVIVLLVRYALCSVALQRLMRRRLMCIKNKYIFSSPRCTQQFLLADLKKREKREG